MSEEKECPHGEESWYCGTCQDDEQRFNALQMAKLAVQIAEGKKERLDCAQRWLNDASAKAEIIAALQTKNTTLWDALGMAQWGNAGLCPICGGCLDLGHESHCMVRAALKEKP